MNLFYHHVGIEGAEEDFKKTVFTDIPFHIIKDNIPEDQRSSPEILECLEENFPRGRFNCWGVPAGAVRVIKNLSPGDAVLLVETTAIDGAIPALWQVKCYRTVILEKLSFALWGSSRFPYIFFFDTEEINLTWGEFLNHFDYKPNYDPRGSFLSVLDARLSKFGGAVQYTELLRTKYASHSILVYPLTSGTWDRELSDEDGPYFTEIEDEIAKLVDESGSSVPQLTDSSEKIIQTTHSSPRNSAFRIGIKQIYGGKCAVCGIGLHSPDGQLETQSAHIYPRERNGSDDLRNGICLCRRHHWAFDVGWISLGDDLSVIVRQDIPKTDEYEFIRRYFGQQVSTPIRNDMSPHPIFLKAHRILHGFE